MTTVEETRRDVVLGNHILAGEGVLDVFCDALPSNAQV